MSLGKGTITREQLILAGARARGIGGRGGCPGHVLLALKRDNTGTSGLIPPRFTKTQIGSQRRLGVNIRQKKDQVFFENIQGTEPARNGSSGASGGGDGRHDRDRGGGAGDHAGDHDEAEDGEAKDQGRRRDSEQAERSGGSIHRRATREL